MRPIAPMTARCSWRLVFPRDRPGRRGWICHRIACSAVVVSMRPPRAGSEPPRRSSILHSMPTPTEVCPSIRVSLWTRSLLATSSPTLTAASAGLAAGAHADVDLVGEIGGGADGWPASAPRRDRANRRPAPCAFSRNRRRRFRRPRAARRRSRAVGPGAAKAIRRLREQQPRQHLVLRQFRRRGEGKARLRGRAADHDLRGHVGGGGLGGKIQLRSARPRRSARLA